MITRYLAAFAGAAVVFLGLDFTWLSLTQATLYRPVIGPLMRASPRADAAVLFYLVYLSGLVFFAVRAGLRAGRWRVAALTGAAFGVVAYATYDLTNEATLRLWATQITVLDIAWGAVVSAAGATAGYLAAARVRGTPARGG